MPKQIAILFFLIFLLITQPSYAYIDPGNGSSLFQLILGLILGCLFTLKIIFKKALDKYAEFLRGSRKKDDL